ncbi:MAG: EAL domain-containing protein [Zetaproteobacteria bacterium]|nr:MAG: EAL domain-containing protein [Zetaproteobacteria bacterium]
MKRGGDHGKAGKIMNAKGLSVSEQRLALQFRVIALLITLVPFFVFIYLMSSHGLLDDLTAPETLVPFLLAIIIVLSALALLQSLFNNMSRVAHAMKVCSADELAEVTTQETAVELKEIASSFEQLLSSYQKTQEQLEHQTFELLLIRELSEEAGKSLDLRNLLSILLEKLMRLTHASIGSVFLVEDDGTRFHVVDARGKRPENIVGLELDIDQSAARWVVEHQKPMLVENINEDERLPARRHDSQKYASPSFLSLPVLAGEELIAIVNLADREKGGCFTRADLTSAMVMVQEVRFALDNARMYTALQETADRLEAQNEVLQHEIRKRLKVEKQLEHLAHKDRLTGLANRYLFMDRLEMMLAHARRYRSKVAVMFIDLDRFKTINDTLGHSVGDRILQVAAQRLTGTLREVDMISRYGGDEFTVALPDIKTAEDAALVAQKLLDVFNTPFTLEGREYHLGASIGISLFPDDAENVEGLVKCADAAMYEAKPKSGSAFHFYTEDLGNQAEMVMEMEISLRKAIEQEEFILHYQPFLSLSDGELRGMEVLTRWLQPDRGLVMPDQFIPFAERSGLIYPLGNWVLRSACLQHCRWVEDGLFAGLDKIPCVAVNVSSVQFREPNFIDDVQRILQETGMNPECLELEITEGVLMEQAEESVRLLHQLKEMGVKIAVDDFGTGFSSLSYLKRFPIDTLKVDRSFVARVPEHEQDASIVRAIVDLAHNLHIKVIAEGIEHAEQLAFLRAEGCEWGQGYLFSRPVSSEAMADVLRDDGRKQEWRGLIA